MNDVDGARYISLTTFKRDGTPVASPVWITGKDGHYVFTTGAQAWKARRLLHYSSVQIQVCDMRGRVKPNAAMFRGTGEVWTSPDAIRDAERALAAKYGWQFKATKVVDGLQARLGRGGARAVAAIHLTLAD